MKLLKLYLHAWALLLNVEIDTDSLANASKNAGLIAGSTGAIFTGFFWEVLNPITIIFCGFVGFMWALDISTGFVYHVWIKEPPDEPDKKKVLKSVFQFFLLAMTVLAFAMLKAVMNLFLDTDIAFLVKLIDGGMTGLFMTLLLLLGLVLLYDFVDRSAKMGMPAAPELLEFLRNQINKLKKRGTPPNSNPPSDQNEPI